MVGFSSLSQVFVTSLNGARISFMVARTLHSAWRSAGIFGKASDISMSARHFL
jgi:hypothetical protein